MNTIRRILTATLVLSVLGLGVPAASGVGQHDHADAGRSNLHCC